MVLPLPTGPQITLMPWVLRMKASDTGPGAAQQVDLPGFLFRLEQLIDDLRILLSPFVVGFDVPHQIFVRVGVAEFIGERRIA
jgi:hypothetical protein